MIPPCLTSWPHAAAISRATGPVVAAEYTPPLPPKPPMMAWPFCSTVTPGIKPAKRCRKVNSHHMLLGFTNNSIYCSLPLKYITILMVLYDSINYYYKYISIPLTLWFFGRCSARRLEAQSQWRRPRRPWQNSGHGVWKYGLSISIIYDLWSISIWIWLYHMNPSNPMVYYCPKARNCTYHRHPKNTCRWSKIPWKILQFVSLSRWFSRFEQQAWIFCARHGMWTLTYGWYSWMFISPQYQGCSQQKLFLFRS